MFTSHMLHKLLTNDICIIYNVLFFFFFVLARLFHSRYINESYSKILFEVFYCVIGKFGERSRTHVSTKYTKKQVLS